MCWRPLGHLRAYLRRRRGEAKSSSTHATPIYAIAETAASIYRHSYPSHSVDPSLLAMAWPTVRPARPRASHAQEKTAWAQATFEASICSRWRHRAQKGRSGDGRLRKWRCVRKGDPTEMSETRVRLRELGAVVRPYLQEIESGFFGGLMGS
uniref:Uncharacterized protein n=1 Tax=Oryza meridionalis TaxID=40149 RepID=A0A0E0DUE1_9ORYZ